MRRQSESDDRIRELKKWQPLFPESMVREASLPETQKKIIRFRDFGWVTNAVMQAADPGAGYRGRQRWTQYTVQIGRYPQTLQDEWSLDEMSCSCPEGRRGRPCIHEAAVLTRLEREHGPFIAVESTWEYERRKKRERAEAEKLRLQKLRGATDPSPVPAADFFRDRRTKSGLVIWDVPAILENFRTNAYEMARARELSDQRLCTVRCSEERTRDGRRILNARCSTCDPIYQTWGTAAEACVEGDTVRLTEYANQADMERGRREREVPSDAGSVLNAPELLLFQALWDYADEKEALAGDFTDQSALTFFRSLNTVPGKQTGSEVQAEAERKKEILLYPRIVMEDGSAKLSFKIGKAGARAYVVRNLGELASSAAERAVLTLSKKQSIDFSEADFTDSAKGLFEFISRRVGEISDANEKIESRNQYRYVKTIAVTSALDLKGALLDNFYDVADGQTCEYQDKTNDVKDAEIRIGYQPLHFSLESDRLTDARGTFAGVSVHGLVPVLISGSAHQYLLNASCLSRVTNAELDRLRPFRSVADESGYFRFQVGRDHLQEFYYRVVPKLLESPGIDFTDHAGDEAETYLPPEPVFTFYVDIHTFGNETGDTADTGADADDGKRVLTLRGTVAYGDRICRLGSVREDGAYRDTEQEKRVETAVRRFFGVYHRAGQYYGSVVTDQEVYTFLKEGVPLLEEYGAVKGSEAFGQIRIRHMPQIRFGISVRSGIMNLSLTSGDLTQEELLDLYHSYRRKKKWHKLSSGDYLDLSDDTQLREIEDVLDDMDLSTEALMKKAVAVPAYRALYLDRLLEKHDEITSSRDRVYRALIRNFKTVQDAEAEPPSSLENTLRPYQVYGFKWLTTLAGAGFGGILADEMGLGKTLQMISVLLADREASENEGTDQKEEKTQIAVRTPSLVVCPASLVYNWQEEFRRFAPSLVVRPIAGGAAARREAIDAYDETDVYVISYDLLKRHIAKIEPLSFHFVVLDEAQYIKNAGAAAAKSVKVLHADHRFALTGTPIENRLSELWSIFDFLMPGFLYDRREFEKRIETPIVKSHDEAASAKLVAMTAPFILRRKKEEVLKDLPAKLEEVRYVQLSGEQQKLYDAQVVRLRNTIRTNGEDEKIKVLAELTKIREICCDPGLVFEDYRGESVKRKACLDLIESAIDGGHRMLVFSQFTSMLALLEEDLKEAGIPFYLLTGQTGKEKRLQLVHAFNDGMVPVFLISLKAGGTGLNLTGADVVIHYDPWWNLAAQNQATDRTHRIGQTRQVTVYKMVARGTIEERILELQETKRDLAESVIEGRSNPLASMSKEELLALLEK